MKKLILITLMLLMLFPQLIIAEELYIKLDPYPYSSHVLGEDLVIYGDTNIDHFTLALRYPIKDYLGITKYAPSCTAQQLRNGFTIPTGTFSYDDWPEGDWIIKVQDGPYSDEIIVPMTIEPIYDRSIKVAVYENNALTDLVSYPCRGTILKDNTISFTLADSTNVKIFSWNTLSPVLSGQTRIFIASYSDDTLTDIVSYSGDIDFFNNHCTIKVSDTKLVKLFYWQDGMLPIQ